MTELYPKSYQYPAMLINKQPDAETLQQMFASGEYLISQKVDGCWYQLEKIDDEHIYLFSRTVSKKTGELAEKIACVPHIHKWAKQYLPNDTILIGELYTLGGKSNNVTSIMGALPDKAIDRQFNSVDYGGPLHYFIHDVIKYNGKDLLDFVFEKRAECLISHKENFEGSDYVEIAELYNTIEEDNSIFFNVDPYKYLEDVFASGGEGIVLKYKDGLYQPGKRPTYNRKVKTETSFDAVIVGFVEPEKDYTGKEIETWPYWIKDTEPVTKAYYYGWKAGIKIGAYNEKGQLVEIGSISAGMTDELREDMSINPDEYLNSVVEIQAMSVNKKDHTVRHGRLMRIRDDKPQQDCMFEQIFL